MTSAIYPVEKLKLITQSAIYVSTGVSLPITLRTFVTNGFFEKEMIFAFLFSTHLQVGDQIHD